MSDRLSRLIWRMRHMLVRGSVATHADAGRMQTAQVHLYAAELVDGVEIFLPHGFTMRVQPEPTNGQGAETVVLAIGDDHLVALPPADRRYRPRGDALQLGDAALYTDLDNSTAAADAATHRVQLTRDGSGNREIHLRCGAAAIVLREAGGGTIEIVAPGGVTVSHDLTDYVTPGNTYKVRDMRSIFDGHVHPENDEGGPTSAPTTQQGPN